jgi:hypothetical protein
VVIRTFLELKESYREGRFTGMLGKTHSEETKQKMRGPRKN